jgi:hypothetical protein
MTYIESEWLLTSEEYLNRIGVETLDTSEIKLMFEIVYELLFQNDPKLKSIYDNEKLRSKVEDFVYAKPLELEAYIPDSELQKFDLWETWKSPQKVPMEDLYEEMRLKLEQLRSDQDDEII